MSDEKELTGHESLQIITEMIQKVKGSFNENGSSAILWGAVVGFCGLLSFSEIQWKFDVGFPVWSLILVAVIPQMFIVFRERKKKLVKTYQQAATDNIWLVYGITIIAFVLYQSIVPGVSDSMIAAEGSQILLKNIQTGKIEDFHWYVPSGSSIYLIIYAFPTIATGLVCKFKPMIYGAIICYVFFIVSLFTSLKYDLLLMGLAGIFNWLIPGFILRNRYLKGNGF